MRQFLVFGLALLAAMASASASPPAGNPVTIKGMVLNNVHTGEAQKSVFAYALDGTPEIRAELDRIMAENYPDKGLDGDAARKLQDQFTAKLKYFIAGPHAEELCTKATTARSTRNERISNISGDCGGGPSRRHASCKTRRPSSVGPAALRLHQARQSRPRSAALPSRTALHAWSAHCWTFRVGKSCLQQRDGRIDSSSPTLNIARPLGRRIMIVQFEFKGGSRDGTVIVGQDDLRLGADKNPAHAYLLLTEGGRVGATFREPLPFPAQAPSSRSSPLRLVRRFGPARSHRRVSTHRITRSTRSPTVGWGLRGLSFAWNMLATKQQPVAAIQPRRCGSLQA